MIPGRAGRGWFRREPGFDTLQGPPPAFSGSGDASRANALIGGSTQNHGGLDESLAL
jgi:hypothetical protein